MKEGKNTNEIKFNLVFSLFLVFCFVFLVSEEWWEKISFLCLAVFSTVPVTDPFWVEGNWLFALYLHLEKAKWHDWECPGRCAWCSPGVLPVALLSVRLAHSVLSMALCSSLCPTLGVLNWEVMGRKRKTVLLEVGQEIVVLGVAMCNKNTKVGNKIEEFFC